MESRKRKREEDSLKVEQEPDQALENLPPEILWLIMNVSPLSSIGGLSSINSFFNQITTDNRWWEARFKLFFPVLHHLKNEPEVIWQDEFKSVMKEISSLKALFNIPLSDYALDYFWNRFKQGKLKSEKDDSPFFAAIFFKRKEEVLQEAKRLLPGKSNGAGLAFSNDDSFLIAHNIFYAPARFNALDEYKLIQEITSCWKLFINLNLIGQATFLLQCLQDDVFLGVAIDYYKLSAIAIAKNKPEFQKILDEFVGEKLMDKECLQRAVDRYHFTTNQPPKFNFSG